MGVARSCVFSRSVTLNGSVAMKLFLVALPFALVADLSLAQELRRSERSGVPLVTAKRLDLQPTSPASIVPIERSGLSMAQAVRAADSVRISRSVSPMRQLSGVPMVEAKRL